MGETGDASLAHELHTHGYTKVRERHPEAAAEQDTKLSPQETATT